MSDGKIVNTLTLIYEHPRILLGLKKRGFGEGKWNGFGGKVQIGESIEQAARREISEEIGSGIKTLEKRGVINFIAPIEPKLIEMHVFSGTDLIDEPFETEEMKPQWFSIDEIPFKEMWRDDVYWMPLFLQGKKFNATFWFDEEYNITKQEVTEVESL